MEHPVIIPVIVLFTVVLVGAMIDAWQFKIHYAATFPLVISLIAYQSLGGGEGALQDSLSMGFVGTGVLLLFFALGGLTIRASAEASSTFEHPHQ